MQVVHGCNQNIKKLVLTPSPLFNYAENPMIHSLNGAEQSRPGQFLPINCHTIAAIAQPRDQGE